MGVGRLWCCVERAVEIAEWVDCGAAASSSVAASVAVLALVPEPSLAVGACRAIDGQHCSVWVLGWCLLYRRWRLDRHNQCWATASR